MTYEISKQSVNKAFEDSDKWRLLDSAEREKRLLSNEGVELRIAEDNLLDWVINRVDSRRIILEKKAEVLHDYYGDRLIAKDLFKDYLSYKRYTGGLGHALSLGVLGLNMYTKVMKNSYLLGKVGTLGSIAAIQYLSRSCTNSWLEQKIERPWKIHLHRLSKGLGPTNVANNYHEEILTVPIKTIRFEINSRDLFFNPIIKYVPRDLRIKFPINKEKFPYAYDTEHMQMVDINLQEDEFKRINLRNPEPGTIKTLNYKGFFYWLKQTTFDHEFHFRPHYWLFKDTLYGDLSILQPDKSVKFLAHDVTRPYDYKEGTIIEDNQYQKNPIEADIVPELPPYFQHFTQLINYTDDNIKTLLNHMKLRRQFQLLKKEITDEYIRTGNLQDYRKKLDDYTKQLTKAEHELKISSIKIADPYIAQTENENLILSDSDTNALREYYELIYKTRPVMIKEAKDEFDYDFDFEIDTESYDPWKEYRMIYKDLFKKGRAYFILKSMPEWRFLMRGQPESNEDNLISKYNPKRDNNRDSIFNILSVDRYFHERQTKEGRYKGKSQAIRI